MCQSFSSDCKSLRFSKLADVGEENIFPEIFLPCFGSLLSITWEETRNLTWFFLRSINNQKSQISSFVGHTLFRFFSPSSYPA